GALQCVPKNPDCRICPMNEGCLALKRKKVHELPVNLKKQKITKRYFNYLVFNDEHRNTKIRQRTEKGIWHNLYEFPLLETAKEEDLDVVAKLVVSENDII